MISSFSSSKGDPFIHTILILTSSDSVHLGVSALIGVVLGILSLNLYRLGVFAVGQCLGLVRLQEFCMLFSFS